MMQPEPEPIHPAGATPEEAAGLRPVPVPPRPADVSFRWYHKAGALTLAVFYMAVGLFLLIYPWGDGWSQNYFAAMVPEWHQYWDNLYVRGAVSGLGVLNFYISLAEAFRLRRFSHR